MVHQEETNISRFKMRNITQAFKQAVSSDANWMFNTFYLVIDELDEVGIQVSFWEGEENWASILVDDSIAGYIWKRYPLIVFERGYLPDLKTTISNIGNISCIELDSLNRELLKLDEAFKPYFDTYLDFSSFTMEELWFTTNSRL